MTNLRERKKREIRQRILAIAREVFFEKGYTNTTMIEIAKKVDIGVGTVYNYFPSKAELFLSIFNEEYQKEVVRGEEIISDVKENLVESIQQLISLSIQSFKDIPREFWKEIFGVIMGNFEESRYLWNGFVRLDMEFLNHLTSLIESAKRNKLIAKDFDIETAVQATYSIVLTQIMFYVYQEDSTYENVIDNINKQINFIFKNREVK